MTDETELIQGGAELLPQLQPLWEALFDYHVAVGTGKLRTIERAQSWPRRRAHYEHLIELHPRVSIYLARTGGKAAAYALWHEDEVGGERVAVLESLSVLPEARGLGLGTRLMQTVDAEARACGIALSAVDVLEGNERAKNLYLRYGFEPHAEFWLRSHETGEAEVIDGKELDRLAGELGLEFSIEPGPDDTWISSERMVAVSMIEELTVAGERLAQLFRGFAADGIWTIFVSIPAPPRAGSLRGHLRQQGFNVSMERLTREL